MNEHLALAHRFSAIGYAAGAARATDPKVERQKHTMADYHEGAAARVTAAKSPTHALFDALLDRAANRARGRC